MKAEERHGKRSRSATAVDAGAGDGLSGTAGAVDKHSCLAVLCAIEARRIGTNMLGYWTRTETHHCASGNDQVAIHQAEDIKDLRLNSPVEAIEVGPTTNRVTYRRPDGQHQGTFEYVILAGPPTTWPGSYRRRDSIGRNSPSPKGPP